MSRMSAARRKKFYEFLVLRDGEVCFIGDEDGTTESLIIDHWDGDNSNNDPKNLHLFCRTMNNVKNPRGRDHRHKLVSSVYVCVNPQEDIRNSEPRVTQSAEFLKSQDAQPRFRHWLFLNIVKMKRIALDEAINSGAEIAHVSQVTVKRYLGRVLSEVSIYQIEVEAETGKKFLALKPKWDTFRRANEAKQKLNQQAKNWRDAGAPRPRPAKSKPTKHVHPEIDLAPLVEQKPAMN